MNHQKVIWQEGMLLRPQHFQQNDRYYDHQFRARNRMLGCFYWGFEALDIDCQFLGMGKVVLSQASGILPDGTLFSLDGNSEPLTLNVPPGTSGMPVYLALPLTTGSHVEARHGNQSDVLARYAIHEHEIADSNAGDDSIRSISCARPDFRLLLGEQERDQAFITLKLCIVLEASSESGISLDPGFTPTFIDTHASPYLTSCLKEVMCLLDGRAAALSERLRAHGKGGGEVRDHLMLQAINRTSMLLRHYFGIARVHPEALFRTLLAMLGDVSGVSCDSESSSVDAVYQHSDQGRSFASLMKSIRRLCSTVLEQPAIECFLEERPRGIRVAQLDDRVLYQEARFILVAAAQCDPEVLRQRLPAHLKVGPVEQIRQLVNLHLPGIRVRPLPVAPREIPFHSNKAYFVLDFCADDLLVLERSGGLAFHVCGDLAALELKLWAIRS